MERFNIFAIWRAHWYGLSTRTKDGVAANWPLRVLTLLVPVIVGALILRAGVPLAGVIAAVVIAAGTFTAGMLLSVFSHIASWRERLRDRDQQYFAVDQPTRDMLDEATGHLLEAVVEAIWLAVFGALATALTAWHQGSRYAPIATATAAALATHIALLVLILCVQLYAGYRDRNKVRPELDGFDTTAKPRSASARQGIHI